MTDDIKRRIAYTQNWHEFCNKYRIVPASDDHDSNICDAIKTIVTRNELKRQEHKEGYIKMSVYLKSEEIVSGYFTIREIDDISFLDSRLKLV